LRIISGYLKSRRINAPKNLPVRPTTDRAKESLFNILNNLLSFEEIKVLDLFAGTGSITYEFASRGCDDITSIEYNNKCYGFIKSTLQQLDINVVKLIRADVFRCS